jgi:D-inositol-3-phosphate glycosyltransferase
VRHDHVAGKNIAVIPCGVRLDRFYPLDKSAARRLIGFGPDDTLILYVGRFDPLKGIEQLLQALPLLKNKANPRVVIVGGDGDRSPATLRLRELARDLGILDSVHFPGRVDHDRLSAYYSAAAVLVLPSSYESFGMVLLESLACGTPVVTTPVGDVEKFIQELENGTIVNDASPAELARGIRKVISLCRPAEAVRSSVKRYTWSQIAGSVLDEYSTAVELNRTRPAAQFYSNPAGGVHARKPASAMCRQLPGLTAAYEPCIK